MFLRFSALLLVTSAFCDAAFIDTLGKCSIKDNECQRKLYTDSVQGIAKSGIPEYGIPPFDPYVINDITVSVLNLANITMIDGVAKNLKSCVFNNINTEIEKLHSTLEITCDVTVKGKYKVEADNPLLKNLLGSGSVRGEGSGKVVIEKFNYIFDVDFFLREVDGELYIDWKYDYSNFKYNFGKVTFAADNIVIADQEVSKQIIPLMNSNWKFIMDSFSKPFVDKAMDVVNEQVHKFFDVTPIKQFLLEDLREYYKN